MGDDEVNEDMKKKIKLETNSPHSSLENMATINGLNNLG